MAAGSEKITPWWNQDVKKASRTEKDFSRSYCDMGHSSSDLQFRYSEARKAAALAVKMSKERFWEKFGRWLFGTIHRILANHSLAWEKFKYRNLHQEFIWKHP